MRRSIIAVILFIFSIFIARAIEAQASEKPSQPEKSTLNIEAMGLGESITPTVISPERNDSRYWPYNIDTREGATLRGVSSAPPVFMGSNSNHPTKESSTQKE